MTECAQHLWPLPNSCSYRCTKCQSQRKLRSHSKKSVLLRVFGLPLTITHSHSSEHSPDQQPGGCTKCSSPSPQAYKTRSCILITPGDSKCSKVEAHCYSSTLCTAQAWVPKSCSNSWPAVPERGCSLPLMASTAFSLQPKQPKGSNEVGAVRT